MEIYTTQRPWAPLAAARLQDASRLLITGAAPIPQAHQVQIQAELVQDLGSAGTKETSGFTVKDVSLPTMQGTDVRGVPPRGRPV